MTLQQNGSDNQRRTETGAAASFNEAPMGMKKEEPGSQVETDQQ